MTESRYSNAEMIASYADTTLKAGGQKLSVAQIEAELEKVCSLFTYVTDKDMFMEIYRNQLVSCGPAGESGQCVRAATREAAAAHMGPAPTHPHRPPTPDSAPARPRSPSASWARAPSSTARASAA